MLKFPDGTYLNSGGSLVWTSVSSFGAGFSLFGAGTAFTLPVGYRPTQTLLFPGFGASFIEVWTDGTVHPSWGTDPGLITLDGIAFSTV